MAIYNPDLQYLEKQLHSLNQQDYGNIELIFLDDSSDNIELIEKTIKQKITNFKFSFYRNEKNLGSNKTFEKLTMLCKTDFIAYCDQDDIWNSNKISECVKSLSFPNVVIAYSDLEVIDENDNVIFKSLRECRKRVKHKNGANLWKYFIRMNSITGCTMMIKTDIAKSAIPFPDKNIYVWDQWLAIIGSMKGNISYIPHTLIKYRLHSANQIGNKKLIGISNKNDYIKHRVMAELTASDLLLSIVHERSTEEEILKQRKMINNRLRFLQEPRLLSFAKIIKLLPKDPQLFFFETVLVFDKRTNGQFLINWIKKSKF